MDFELTEEQEAVRELAGKIIGECATPVRLSEIGGFDPELWRELAKAGLLGVALPEEYGGGGMGFAELCVLLEQVGRWVAPVPAYPTLLGADAIARGGTSEQRRRYLPPVAAGELVLALTLGGATAADGTLHGVLTPVPAAEVAGRILVAAGGGLCVVDPSRPGVSVRAVETMTGLPHAQVVLDGAQPEDVLGADLGDLGTRAIAALCAVQLGVSDRALRMTAEYVSAREQFGRPIGSFQAVQQRLADAYIDVECMRWTTWQAVWRIAEGLGAEREARIAKFWAAEGGPRVAATAQQLHGGIGVDLEYPLHRYFLWTKELELTLGASPVHLARLGEDYAR